MLVIGRKQIAAYVDCSSQRVVESFDKLNAVITDKHGVDTTDSKINSRSTLSATASTNQGNVCSWLNSQVEVAQYTHSRACRIAEVYVLEADATSDVLWGLSFLRLSIDSGHGIQEGDKISGSLIGGRHVRNELEDVSCLHGTEYCSLGITW